MKKEIIIIKNTKNCIDYVNFNNNILNKYQGSIAIKTIDLTDIKEYKLTTNILTTAIVFFINKIEVNRIQTNTTVAEFYQALARFKLNQAAYAVAFNHGTDYKYCQQYEIFKNTNSGVFVDVLSGIPLFDSAQRFNSGSGWLSFYEPITNAVIEKTDNSFAMHRVEVVAKISGIHLGHAFNDAPNNKRRFCINATMLDFIKND